MFRMCLDQWERIVATFHANTPTSTKEPDQEFRSGGHPQPRRPPFQGVEEQNPPNPALSDEHRAVTSAAWTYR